MNTEAITRTIQLIEKRPAKQFKMGSFSFNPKTKRWDDEPTCGTAACIAGFVLAACKPGVDKSSGSFSQGAGDTVGIGGSFSHRAGAVLGIDLEGGQELFFMRTLRYEEAYLDLIYKTLRKLGIKKGLEDCQLAAFDLLPARIRKRAAVIVLQKLASTGKVDWFGAITNASSEHKQQQP